MFIFQEYFIHWYIYSFFYNFYSYDLGNGNGVKTETLSENIRTNTYTVPTMEAVASFTDTTIRYETVIKVEVREVVPVS